MISKYIDNINQRYKLGNATEHTFRGDLQQLIENLIPDVRATNEPKRQKCGAPDYILIKKDTSTRSAEIPVGFIEAKDIADKDLDGLKKTGNKEQFDRYKASLNNLIFTDYLNFHLYRDGQFITKIAIAEVTDKGIKPLPQNFAQFENLIRDFCTTIGQTIKSSKKLSQMMAGKARLLSDVIEKSLTSDNSNNEDSTLKDQMNAFKQILIHDITPKSFADVYAQTIAYGMFAARYHDPTLPTFSRQEAYELIPKSNPFLKKLFGYIAGLDVDDRIKWIVDDLINIFLACNVEELLKDYGKGTKMEDPIIHFYEDFLSEYDPALRKARGVWYTPQPVVNFIVRAVDDILKTEFDLPQGLADTSKTTIKVDMQGKKVEQDVHRVQILDPATGTGTFLAEVVKLIHKKFEGQQGIWSNYVENQLLPRLNGFELLMASYAMAHLKLDLLLTETGYKPTRDQRFKIYLTNSLEEHHPDTGTLWANWLSTEANEANRIKRDTPVMCVIGNPPYSVSSSNKSEWIEKLTADYKKDLNERNIQPLSDDYIKFIRFGQHFIDKNGSGILAYISNNSFIDGIIHRQMRKNLLESFDKIYILDLHGNAKKKEVCPDGSPDQNVFDIMQGVSINIFVKTGKKKKTELGQVFHFDLFGKREEKYDFLKYNSIPNVSWNILKGEVPNNLFVIKDSSVSSSYNNGFCLDEIWNKTNTGVETGKDVFFISDDKKDLINRFENITQEIITKFQIKDGSSFRFLTNLQKNSFSTSYIQRYLSKPFDFKFCYYNPKILRRASYDIQKELIQKKNVALICKRGRLLGNDIYSHISICNTITDKNFLADQSYIFPLYLYPETTAQQTIGLTTERTPNLNFEIVNQIANKLNLTFVPEKSASPTSSAPSSASEPVELAPIDILDYIYAVLHSPAYREKYKEFLKIDFPRVPYPKDATTFWQLVKLGGEIRQIHLLESPIVDKYISQYPVDGNNVVKFLKAEKSVLEMEPEVTVSYAKDGSFSNARDASFYQKLRVWINDTQYFDNVPELAWNFYIGGYQPAQKWLKDRKERTLEFEDILHYQKIIVALTETDRLMKEIDRITIE